MLGTHEPSATRSLVTLLGRTRTALLDAIADRPGCSSSELAHALEVSPASVSQHATVLRESGLILTRRDGKSVHHTLTDLGKSLLGTTG